MTTAFGFDQLSLLLGSHDRVDVPCPACGPGRTSPENKKRPVLRLWQRPGLISFHCARCGESGFVRPTDARDPVDEEALRKDREEHAARDRQYAVDRLATARTLWRHRKPLQGSLGERYLREARGITCALPATLGYLPPRAPYPPSLVAAFGMATEPGPGRLTISPAQIIGLHLTRLQPDGRGRADEERPKRFMARSAGWPIVLAPTSDALALAICEGIEDALSVHEATGLGAWAAGAASRLPGLADKVPEWCDWVSIFVDDDEDGRRHATALAEGLKRRGIHVEQIRELGGK